MVEGMVWGLQSRDRETGRVTYRDDMYIVDRDKAIERADRMNHNYPASGHWETYPIYPYYA